MPRRPHNVIWITTDHMRYDCVGANGNPAMHTPTLDALAAGGVSFDGCYGQNPVCMPSRCSFMTGCYPQQTGVMQNGQELPADFRPTAPQAFSAAGYRTVQIGKLHFQCHEDHDLDPRARNAYGFDVFELSEEPGCYEDAYRTWLRGERRDLVHLFSLPRPVSYERAKESSEFRVLDAPWEASHSGWVATQACRYLGATGRRDEPQFLHLGFYAPHPPLNPTREMFEPYRDAEIPEPLHSPNDWNARTNRSLDLLRDYRRHFCAMVTGVDLAVGKVIDHLRRADQLDDTLLIFSSDHGDACGDHGHIGKGATYYESIMHLPLILHWPGELAQPGRRVGGLVEMVDLLPTLLELVGAPVPRAMQGRSYAEALRDGSDADTRDDVYAVHHPGHVMLRTERHKYLRYADGREVLYDLAADPAEFTNRADAADQAATVRELRDRAFARTVDASRSILERRLRY
jgi:arylsulfatase A-like enzyme